MAFKLKDGIKIGTTDIFNNSAQLLAPTVLGSAIFAVNGDLTKDGIKVSPGSVGTGSYRIELLPATLTTNRTLTLPNNTGTVALTSDINNSALTLSINATAGPTASTVTVNNGTGFTANASSASTYDLKVGPALTALASTMTGAGSGFIKKSGADTYTLDTNTYLTSYTETDTLATVTGRGATTSTASTFNGGITTGGVGITYNGSTSGTTVLKAAAAAGTTTITMPATTGTMALTSDIANGAFGVSIGTAGATNTTVTWGTASGFTANASSASTYDLKVGPALTALASTMTGAGSGFIKKSAADTYTVDTNTYLTSYTETDTLQTVTGRGASSNVATISLTGGTISSSSTSGTLVVTGGVGVSGALNIGGAANIGGSLTVTGDLTVNGTTTTVNSTTLSVDDKNIELGSIASPTDTTADGGGITLKGTTDKTFNWINSTGYWTASTGLSAPTLISTVATGAAPLVVASTTLISNLNADLLDGQHAAYYAAASSIGNGAFGVSIGTAGATNTTVTWGTAGGFTANASSASTYDLKVGPALTALATLMTSGSTGFIKRSGQDTYTIDTNTYLTSYTETDTLQTVTTRGNSTTTDVKLYGSSLILATSGGANKVFKTTVIPSNITANTAATIDSWATATYRSAKYTIQITQGTKYQISEYYMIHDGTAATITEFAVLETSSIPITFSAAIAAGTLTLSATITDAATTNASIIIERTLFAV